MTDLTPEAVKAARERVTQFLMMELPGQPMMMHMGTSNLVNELDAIARDWLRLKEVEKAGEVLSGYVEGIIEDGCPRCGGDCSAANPPVAFCPIRIASSDLAAFRAAVEGK